MRIALIVMADVLALVVALMLFGIMLLIILHRK